MNAHISYLIQLLLTDEEPDDDQLGQYIRSCDAVGDVLQSDVVELLEALLQHVAMREAPQERLIDPLLSHLVQRQRQVGEPLEDPLRDRIVLLYQKLGGSAWSSWRLLQWLATAAQWDDLRALTECLIADSPDDLQAAALVLTPLFQCRDYDPAALFPQLFAALQHLSIAAPILDLSNFVTRAGLVAQHPATGRSEGLISLLGSLVQQLLRVEESPASFAESPEVLSRKVDECVALVVSLSDALSLLGERQAVGKLSQALDLGHRRIRTAAAAALASLGESRGAEVLVSLAAEPVSRLRVIAHAEELGLDHQIDPKYLTDEARAEAQVALELSQPTYFGLPPVSLDLIGSRTLFWPGYEAPVSCFLFRYEYCFETGQYSNVAIAGPLVHAFAADLNDLPPDDIYAVYAGWHVEDESVFEVLLDAPTISQRAECDRLERRLRDEDYEAIQSVMLGYFFGDRVLIARARRQGVAGVVVVDERAIEWHPQRTQKHPIGPHEAFCIYKGRRLLRSFNG